MTKEPTAGKYSKAQRTQRKIMDSYLALMSHNKWDKITVKMVCANAEITRGTFYQYYNSISDLMESIETFLLQDLSARYERIRQIPYAAIPVDHFVDKFDYSPPAMLVEWFVFCQEHKQLLLVLLHSQNGNPHFTEHVKDILQEYINDMMDSDGRSNDNLRTPFVRMLLEMHLMAAVYWMEKGCTDFMPIEEIVHLLNTTRIGSSYLDYKRRSDPNFNMKIKSPVNKTS